MYMRYASKILCIDSTHGTNAYKFKLLTAMVADDFAAGKKICFMSSIGMYTLCLARCMHT